MNWRNKRSVCCVCQCIAVACLHQRLYSHRLPWTSHLQHWSQYFSGYKKYILQCWLSYNNRNFHRCNISQRLPTSCQIVHICRHIIILSTQQQIFTW